MKQFFEELYLSWYEELIELTLTLSSFFNELFEYVDLYPFVLGFLWCAFAFKGVLIDLFYKKNPSNQTHAPEYTVLIPFYAEVKSAIASAQSLSDVKPAPLEIILINDGTPDDLYEEPSNLPPRTKILNLPRNKGKAGALNDAIKNVKTKLVVCLDADTQTISKKWSCVLGMFNDPKLAGVTGKIRPKSTSRLAQVFQSLDYLAVICLIKKAEAQWGCLMTLSGAWSIYRVEAIKSVGGWSEDVSAEDIDISWRLQSLGWKLSYDSHWISAVDMAPTWKSLWKQRRRWSSGLGRTIRDNFFSAFKSSSTNAPVAFLTLFSNIWIFLFVFFGTIRIFIATFGELSIFNSEIFYTDKDAMFLAYTSLFLFLVQVGVAILIDQDAWQRYPLLVLIMPLYYVYFLIILAPSFIVGFPKGFFRRDMGLWSRTVRTTEVKC